MKAAYGTVTNCGAIEGDFTKLSSIAAQYSDPVSAILKIGYDIIFNGVNIYSDLSSAVQNWDVDFYQFGVDIGKAGNLIIIGAVPSDPFMHPRSRAQFIGNNKVRVAPERDLTVTDGDEAFKM